MKLSEQLAEIDTVHLTWLASVINDAAIAHELGGGRRKVLREAREQVQILFQTLTMLEKAERATFDKASEIMSKLEVVK
jgi:hypothetical protein